MSSIPTYPQFHSHTEDFGTNLTRTVLTTRVRKKFRGVWYLITVRSEGVHNSGAVAEAYRQFMREVYATMLLGKKQGVKDDNQMSEIERLIRLL